MGCQDGVTGLRYKEVFVLRIGLMHVLYSMYFYYLLLSVIHVLSLEKLGDLLIYLIPRVMCCISAEPLYVCQMVGVWIGKWLPNLATTDDIASHTGFTQIGSSDEI